MGRRPEILVTGPRHSGTTFVMQLARELGWDLGAPLHSLGEAQGLEWIPFHDIADEISAAVTGGPEPRDGWTEVDVDLIEEVRATMRPRIEALEFPEVVKCPELGQHIVLDMVAPRLVVVLVRDADGWIRSMQKNEFARVMSRKALRAGMTMKIGALVCELERLAVPYRLVRYPQAALDIAYATREFGTLLSRDADTDTFARAWTRVRRDDLIDRAP